MLKPIKKFKDGGVSICFHCHKQLVRTTGEFLFAIVLDPTGNEVRVHKGCVRHAVGYGYTAAAK